jgi:hypothetical protein
VTQIDAQKKYIERVLWETQGSYMAASSAGPRPIFARNLSELTHC